MIIIVGEYDIHTARVINILKQKGEDAVCFDTSSFQKQLNFSVSEGLDGCLKLFSTGQKIPLKDIKSVYWYCYNGINAPADITAYDSYVYTQNIEAALGSLFLNLECLWVNHPETVFMHKFKGNQLKLIQSAGVQVPKTLITNDYNSGADFYEKHARNIIFKPLSGGIPQKISKEQIIPENFENPVQLQEYIEGVDIRAHIVKNEIFATEIRSSASNYKIDPQVELIPIKLPDEVEKDCFKIAEKLGLILTGIDIRRTISGKYVYFEANPSPQYLVFEDRNNYPISERLATALIEGK